MKIVSRWNYFLRTSVYPAPFVLEQNSTEYLKGFQEIQAIKEFFHHTRPSDIYFGKKVIYFAFPYSSMFDLHHNKKHAFTCRQSIENHFYHSREKDPRYLARVVLPCAWAKMKISILYVYSELYNNSETSGCSTTSIHICPFVTNRE